MKKHIVIITFAIIALLLAGCKKKDKETISPGSIYGTITDKATGDCVPTAGVELMPKGLKTVTGSDGSFQFTQIDPGDYNLFITKTGYQDLKSSTITVKSGEQAKGDVQIEKLPSVLRIVNSDGEDISDLDFGAEYDVTSRTFSIFNDSPRRITWWIEENCNWIIEVKSMLSNEQSGTIVAGEQEPIKVTIDRSLLAEGLQSYILNINSDNGSKELLITAGEDIGLPSLTTDPVSDLTQNSATFNGTITSEGLPSYTERGFVYSTTAQPTIENNLGKITSAVSSQASFSANVSGLSPNSSYYVRAYAINTTGVAYGNDVAFTTGSIQTTVTTSAATNIDITSAKLNGIITEAGSPAYTEKGFCYNTTDSPTISDNRIIVDGSGTGAYSTSIDNLDYHTTYHVKAYAIQNGEPVYGTEVTFTTTWTDTQVQTSAVTYITATSATFNGVILNAGSPAYTERGFCYSNSTTAPTINNNYVAASGSGVSESYSIDVASLDDRTTYYVRAYVIQNNVEIYGNVVHFTTLSGEIPDAPSGVTASVVNSSILISWNSVEDADEYKVYRSYNDVGFDLLGTTPNNFFYDVYPYEDNYYFVTAVNSFGESDYTYTVHCPYSPGGGGGSGTATIILIAGDVWGDGTGYQMLLDDTHSLYGTTIPEDGALSLFCSGNEYIYNQFSHKIPLNADGYCSTSNIVLNNSVTMTIPAGTYDWCITNPTPGDRIWIASSQGNIGGRQDNYEFEAGNTYEFTVSMLGQADAVNVVITGGAKSKKSMSKSNLNCRHK